MESLITLVNLKLIQKCIDDNVYIGKKQLQAMVTELDHLRSARRPVAISQNGGAYIHCSDCLQKKPRLGSRAKMNGFRRIGTTCYDCIHKEE